MEFQWSAWIQAKAWALEVGMGSSELMVGRRAWALPCFSLFLEMCWRWGGKKVLCSHPGQLPPRWTSFCFKNWRSLFSPRTWNQKCPGEWRQWECGTRFQGLSLARQWDPWNDHLLPILLPLNFLSLLSFLALKWHSLTTHRISGSQDLRSGSAYLRWYLHRVLPSLSISRGSFCTSGLIPGAPTAPQCPRVSCWSLARTYTAQCSLILWKNVVCIERTCWPFTPWKLYRLIYCWLSHWNNACTTSETSQQALSSW